MEIVKTNTEDNKSLTDVQLEAFKQSQAELDSYKKELETKKYLVDVKKDEIEAILGYMRDEAAWKFTESLGIKEVVADLESCSKKGKMFMIAISIEALYFYLSRVEGKGNTPASVNIKSLDQYLTILKAINVVRNVIANENAKLKELEFVAASRAEGLTPENSEAIAAE